jgi:hypothetical protein
MRDGSGVRHSRFTFSDTQVAREAGVSVSRLRKRLAGKESADPEMEN